MSGRGGSGSFGSGRTAGYAIGEERTSPWLEAIAGIRSNRIPGWAPSPCRLPGPVTRCETCTCMHICTCACTCACTCTCLRRVFTAATVSSTPFRAPVSVCGAGCARLFPSGPAGSSIGAIFGFLGNLGNWSLGNLRNRLHYPLESDRVRCMLGRACMQGKVCRAYLLWSLVILRVW